MPISISGMDELLARLKMTTLNVNLVENEALIAGADIIRDEIEARAPVKSGTLKNNIVTSGIRQDWNGVKHIKVGPDLDAFWGRFQEFGTVHQKARPFVEPAFLSKRKEALAVMKEAIKEAVESG